MACFRVTFTVTFTFTVSIGTTPKRALSRDPNREKHIIKKIGVTFPLFGVTFPLFDVTFPLFDEYLQFNPHDVPAVHIPITYLQFISQ